jgi:hypothetical protein
MDDDKKLSKYNKSDVLGLVTDWFKTSASAESEWKDKAKEWYGYYDGEQWTSDEVAALIERGQAITTYNHISPSIDAIIGGERQNRPEIKMAGRTPDDERVAQVKTELFRYITYNRACVTLHRLSDISIYRHIEIHRHIDISIHRPIDISTYRHINISIYQINISIYQLMYI